MTLEIQTIDSKILQKVIIPRPADSNKFTFGQLLIVAGSKQFGGAALMAVNAAVQSGTGLVTLASDPLNRNLLLSQRPEAMFIDDQDTAVLNAQLDKVNTVLIGPGLGTSDTSLQMLKNVFNQVTDQQQLILDGSALTLIAEHQLALPQTTCTIITPHQGEWRRLSGLTVDQQTLEANQRALNKIDQLDLLVLKGPKTHIYQTHQQTILALPDHIGGPFQATGGMGDTLAGIIAGFVSQFKQVPVIDRVTAAVLAHSQIATELANTQYVTLPTQIANQLPAFMARVIKN